MGDVTGVGEAVRGVIETGTGRKLCSHLGRFGREREPSCMNVGTKEVMQRHVGDAFPICNEQFDEFGCVCQLVVVPTL